MYIIIKRNIGNQQYVGSTSPSVHPDETKALAEAQRLAFANPGWEFVVFKGQFALVNMPHIVHRNL